MRHLQVTLLAVGAAIGGLLFGLDTSTMNAAIVGIRETLALGAASVGFLAAISLIGCAVGAWFAGPVAARHGRTRVMSIAGVLVAAGTLAVAASGGLVAIGICRFATGVGIGAASAVVDRVGRRTMLGVGAAVMAGALALLAYSFSTVSPDGEALALDPTAGIGALVAMNLFAIAFGITWGPVMWVMVNELFDARLRTTAVAVCTAVNWLGNWLVVRTFPVLADVGLAVAYALFAAFAALACLFAWRALPETRGEELR
jgi:MFS family permease